MINGLGSADLQAQQAIPNAEVQRLATEAQRPRSVSAVSLIQSEEVGNVLRRLSWKKVPTEEELKAHKPLEKHLIPRLTASRIHKELVIPRFEELNVKEINKLSIDLIQAVLAEKLTCDQVVLSYPWYVSRRQFLESLAFVIRDNKNPKEIENLLILGIKELLIKRIIPYTDEESKILRFLVGISRAFPSPRSKELESLMVSSPRSPTSPNEKMKKEALKDADLKYQQLKDYAGCNTPCSLPVIIQEIARSFFNKTLKYFKEVSPRDFVKGAPPNSNLDAYIAYYNNISFFVTHQVLKFKTYESRVKMMECFLAIALELKKMCDFNTSTAIFAGLHNSSLSRLQKLLSPAKNEEFSESINLPNNRYGSTRNSTEALFKDNLPYIPLTIICKMDLKVLEENTNFANERLNLEKPMQIARALQFITKAQEVTALLPCSQNDLWANFSASLKFKELQKDFEKYFREQSALPEPGAKVPSPHKEGQTPRI